MKALDVAETFRSYHAADPAIGGQVEASGAVPYGLIDLGQQERAAQRRLQRGPQQPVITVCLVPRYRAECVSPNTMGPQPLARFGGGQIATNLAAEIDGCG